MHCPRSHYKRPVAEKFCSECGVGLGGNDKRIPFATIAMNDCGACRGFNFHEHQRNCTKCGILLSWSCSCPVAPRLMEDNRYVYRNKSLLGSWIGFIGTVNGGTK